MIMTPTVVKTVLMTSTPWQRAAGVKLGYEEEVKEITKLREQLHNQMNEKLNLFNTLIEEIKKATNDYFAFIEKDLDDAIEKVSRFSALCAQNIKIFGILAKSNAILQNRS